jgi:hypothetical protein
MPRGTVYEPGSAPGQITLQVLRGGRVRVTARDGSLEPVPLQDLPSTLALLRQAYPGDDALLLIPSPDALHGEVVAVAGLARRRDGLPLFPILALAPASFAAAAESDLAPVLRLLSAARVGLDGGAPQSWAEPLRSCYLDLLRGFTAPGRAPPEGTIVLRAGPGGVRLAEGGTLRRSPLAACALKALGALPGPAAPAEARITVTFRCREP